MADALVWLLTVEVLGLLALPLCFVLFRRLPDRGMTLAKPMALVLLAYVLWIAGLTRLIPNTQGTIIAIAAAVAVVSAVVLRGQAKQVQEFVKAEWRTLVAAEAVFLVFFFLWLWVTSEAPAIRGTEKPMDFGFLNAVLQSRHFPPEDQWLSGHSISYYYGGHFIMALLVKLTAIPSNVGYNLAVSLVPALAATGAFGLLYNLVRLSGGSIKAGIGFGLAAPALILLIGNLAGALEFVNVRGWGRRRVLGLGRNCRPGSRSCGFWCIPGRPQLVVESHAGNRVLRERAATGLHDYRVPNVQLPARRLARSHDESALPPAGPCSHP